MKHVLAAVLIWFAATVFVRANDDIKSVISSQIEAFKQDDFITAFDFASPMIQGMFGTPERFGLMVRNGYPMVWRPAEVEFLSVEERGSALVQNVMIKDQSGALFILEYEMIQAAEGWLINGVVVKRADDSMA